jgi:BirA family transcriptional regulator, biotin operon repressor / biotin---[acetyl-CoA-carboxylase] ligase
MEPLKEEILRTLTSRWLGRHICFYQDLDSTNRVAQELARQGAAEGTAVLAERQLSGRGRQGRVWYSPAGVGLYSSVILRAALPPNQIQLLTLAVVVARAISAQTLLSPRIKWPNDILIGGKRVAGILTEAEAAAERIAHVVVGVGINANHTAAELGQPLEALATSLRLEVGRLVERSTLAAQLFAELESWYERLKGSDSSSILDEWRQHAATLGRRVRVFLGQTTVEGTALDLTNEGALLVERQDGSRTVVHAGDVEHLRLVGGGSEGG